ncbi:MAG: twin-arginine translocase TatA/TatE family subunit [Phycisphaerae bacterium]
MLAFWMPGPWELAIIAIIALILFGRRLPEVGKSLGKGIVEFKKGLKDVQDEVQKTGDAIDRATDEDTSSTETQG